MTKIHCPAALRSIPAQGGVAAFNTSALAPGSYTAWYLYNDGYTPLAGAATFIVSQ